MKNKILYSTDWHVDPTSEYSRLDNNLNSINLEIIRKMVVMKLELIHKYHNELALIVIGGDLFCHNGNIDPISNYWIQSMIFSITETASAYNIPVRIIHGNHDVYDTDYNISLLHFADFLPNTVLVRKDYHELISIGEGKEHAIGYFSYQENYDGLNKLINDDKCEIIFTHLDFVGAMIKPKLMSKGGCNLTSITSDHYVDIINGHYHLPSLTNLTKKIRLIHPGAPYYRNHTDEVIDTHRGIMLYDIPSGKYEIIPNYNTEYYYSYASDDINLLMKEMDSVQFKDKSRVKIFSHIEKEKLNKDLSIFKDQFLSIRLHNYPTRMQFNTENIKKLTFEEAIDKAIKQMDTSNDREILRDILVNELIKHEDDVKQL